MTECPEWSENKVSSTLNKTSNSREDKRENGVRAVKEHISWPKTGLLEVQTRFCPFLSVIIYKMKTLIGTKDS